MTRKMFFHGFALAVSLMLPALAAPKTHAGAASCCATKTRCCDKVRFCCDQPDKAKCCRQGVACCDKTPCCGPEAKAKAAMTEKAVKPGKASKKAAVQPCCAKKARA